MRPIRKRYSLTPQIVDTIKSGHALGMTWDEICAECEKIGFVTFAGQRFTSGQLASIALTNHLVARRMSTVKGEKGTTGRKFRKTYTRTNPRTQSVSDTQPVNQEPSNGGSLEKVKAVLSLNALTDSEKMMCLAGLINGK